MKKGAPPKYTDNQLRDSLLEFITKNPGKKINPSILERETGINRFIWTRRMSDQIAKLNQTELPEITTIEAGLPLPNIVKLVENYWNNKTGLINALSHFNELLNALYQKAKAHDSIQKKSQDLASNLSLKEEQIKRLENEIILLKKQYLEIAVKSTYKSFQEEGLEKVISITKNKRTEARALNTDIVKMYPELFND